MIVIHKERDITEYITSITWSGSTSEVARKLEIRVVNAPLDDNITPLKIGLADPIYLFDDDGKELFRGYVTEREAVSSNGEISYVAYDLLYYTLKSSATYNFSKKTAEAITKMVCNDMEIPVGKLAETGYSQKLIAQGKSIYEIIMMAYTQAHEQNDKKYYVTAKKGKLNVEEMGQVVCEIELSEDSNILSSKFRENLNNMVNRVKIYDGEGKQVGVVEKEKDLKYGIFQQTYTKEEGKNATTTAKSMLNGVEQTYELECMEYPEVITGTGVVIKDSTTGLKGLVWVDSDTHTWANGVSAMSLSVTLKLIMDTKEAD